MFCPFPEEGADREGLNLWKGTNQMSKIKKLEVHYESGELKTVVVHPWQWVEQTKEATRMVSPEDVRCEIGLDLIESCSEPEPEQAEPQNHDKQDQDTQIAVWPSSNRRGVRESARREFGRAIASTWF